MDPAVPIGDLHGTTTGIDIAHAAEAERTRLRAEAANLGGPSPLVSFRDTPESGIDISKAYTTQFVCKGVGMALKK